MVFSKKGFDLKNKDQHTTKALKDATHRHGQNNKKLIYSMESWENAIVASGDIAEEIIRLKEQSGKPILAHGGASFNRSLIATGLVDEYKLLIHPVILGKGLPLFSALPKPLDLILCSTKVLSSGCIASIYRPLQSQHSNAIENK